MDFLPFLPFKPVEKDSSVKETSLLWDLFSTGCHDSDKVPSRKLASQWKVTIFNRRYIFIHGWFFHLHITVVFGGVSHKNRPALLERFSFIIRCSGGPAHPGWAGRSAVYPGKLGIPSKDI